MCFALCTSLAFAQTKHASHRGNATKVTAAKSLSQDNGQPIKGYKAYIFNATKDGDDALFSCDFSEANTGYSTGTIDVTSTILNPDGSSVLMIKHTQTNAHSKWQRIADASEETMEQYADLTAEQGGYPVTLSIWYDFTSMENAPTGNNGFMIMTMLDQYLAGGGSGATGNFDAYIAFDPFSTASAAQVEFSFFQIYTCFNNDKTYIDYSTDGNEWYQYEINVKGVDLGANDDAIGKKRVMLPAACGSQENVYLRLRWTCDNSAGGVYGYVWYVDDVKVTPAAENEILLQKSRYDFGVYHQVPQGLDVPITWWTSIQNFGTATQNEVTLSMNHLDANQSSLTELGSMTYGPLNPTVQKDTCVGALFTEENDYGWWVVSPATPNAAGSKFPTTTVGDNYIVPGYGASNCPTKYGDTILYMVNTLQRSPDGQGQVAVWAQDNGILTPYAYCVDGLIQEGDATYRSTGIGDENPSYVKPGYDLWNRFVTGATVPDNWVIRGMQLVAATQYSATNPSQNIYLQPGAKITASLYMDSTGSVLDDYLETGAGEYQTTAADYNYFDENMTRITRTSADFKEYMLPGEYKEINIMFPEQPELLPNTSYRLGYELVEGFFAVASQSTRYVHHYDDDPDTLLYYVYFSSDTLKDGTTNELRKYGRYFGEGNGENHIAYDPEIPGLTADVSQRVPMIRMLVGPKVEYPKFHVNVECEGYNGMAIPAASTVFQPTVSTSESVCGERVEMTVGSAGSYVVAEAESGYNVYEVWVDNQLVYAAGIEPTDPNVDHRVNTEYDYDLVYYYFQDYTGSEANIKFIFADASETHNSGGDEGIDDVTNAIHMNLFPNPANGKVNLSIAGVNGKVNCAILDMSGRTVYSQTVNAEETTSLNIANLAKGAYFVRITNNEFTKVEKLVVR